MSLFTPQQHGGEENTGQVKKVENLRKAHFFKEGKNRKDAEIFRFFRFSVLDQRSSAVPSRRKNDYRLVVHII